jgi:hypothetical protein
MSVKLGDALEVGTRTGKVKRENKGCVKHD